MTLYLEKIKIDKETKEEFIAPLTIEKEAVACITQIGKNIYLTTKQGLHHRIPYTKNKIVEILGF